MLSQTAVGCRWPEPRAVPHSDPSQGSAAGGSSSSMHCSQRGCLTPDATFASREVTREPSNHHQINLPPETRGPFTLDSDTHPPPHSTWPCHPTCKAQGRPGACANTVRLPARELQRHQHLCQDSLVGSWPTERWRLLQRIRWGWDSRPGVRQPLFRSAIVH